jgi:hypothetical protein
MLNATDHDYGLLLGQLPGVASLQLNTTFFYFQIAT